MSIGGPFDAVGWPQNHIGCNVSTCPNDRCNASGVCVGGTFVPSPPLVPDIRDAVCKWPAGSARENTCAWPTCRCASDASRPMGPIGDSRRIPSQRTIIAFTGLAGAGKSTAALHLVNRHGFQRVRFAGPLKAMMAALGLTTAEIDGNRKELPCELLGGKTPRHAMQTIGTEWGRKLIGDDLWINAWRAAVDKLPADVPVVVDDCRFPNEAAAIQAAGGVCVRIERAGAGTASVHESEQHQLPVITTIPNDADPAALIKLLDAFVRDWSWAQPAA